MARSFGKIEASFWQNPRVRALTERGRYLLNYLFACPHGNSIGCFRLPMGYAQDDLMWPSERVAEHVSELVRTAFIEYDARHQIVRIVGWFGHNTIENKNVAKGAVKALNALPASPLRSATIKGLEALNNEFYNAEANTVETRSEPVSEQVPTPEPEPEPISVPSERAQAPSMANPPFALTPEESPLDLKAEFWKRSKAYLAKHGVKSPGPLVGKWCREYGNGAVMDALAVCYAESPADSVPFIEATLRSRDGKRNGPEKPNGYAAVRLGLATARDWRRAECGSVDADATAGESAAGSEGAGEPHGPVASADVGDVDRGTIDDPRPRLLGRQ